MTTNPRTTDIWTFVTFFAYKGGAVFIRFSCILCIVYSLVCMRFLFGLFFLRDGLQLMQQSTPMTLSPSGELARALLTGWFLGAPSLLHPSGCSHQDLRHWTISIAARVCQAWIESRHETKKSRSPAPAFAKLHRKRIPQSRASRACYRRSY